MTSKPVQISLLFSLFALMAFPLFYFVYKFGDPEPIAHDFFQYYYLYKDFDISKVIAPHNMRLAGPFIVHLLYKLNLFYNTASAFDTYTSWGFMKQVYFNALLFNYICVSTTCCLLFYLLKKHTQHILLSFIGALLYLLGFGTLFYELMPTTDAFSVLLFTLTLYLYFRQNYTVLLLLAILIFQREYILIAISTLAILDFIYVKQKFYLHILLAGLLFFLIYILLRKTLFYTPHLDHQASVSYFLSSLFKLNFPLWQYLKQTAMTLNVFYLYLGMLIYKKYTGAKTDGFYFLKISVLFVQVNIICHIAGHGTNCGRYFYMLIPLIIFILIKESAPVLAAIENPSHQQSGQQ